VPPDRHHQPVFLELAESRIDLPDIVLSQVEEGRVVAEELAAGRDAVIRHLVRTGHMPSVAELATDLRMRVEAVWELLLKLHQEHVLLLNARGEISMLWPFSGVPTPFRVTTAHQSDWANCAWDALGIPAALHTDAVVDAAFACPPGETTIQVQGDHVTHGDYLVHFGLPVSRLYDDLAYT
jgi:hypothetical protein